MKIRIERDPSFSPHRLLCVEMASGRKIRVVWKHAHRGWFGRSGKLAFLSGT